MAINEDGSIHTEGAVAADPYMNLLFQAAMGLIEKKNEEDKGEVTKQKVVTGAGGSSSSGSSQPQGLVAVTQNKTTPKDETPKNKKIQKKKAKKNKFAKK